jgi:hypothetical protein
MNRKSIWAVAAGVLVGVVVTTLVDFALHLGGVYPAGAPLDDGLALLATSYRIIIGIASAWLTARLAPSRPMQHAMILGGLGMAAALIGVVVTWNLQLGPRWYPIALVVLAIPQAWAGAKLFQRGT